MPVKLAFYASSNSLFPPKIAQIMFDSQNNASLAQENASFYFKKNVETHTACNMCLSATE